MSFLTKSHFGASYEEWGIDMDECLNVFNMDVGEEYEERTTNDQAGKSSTHPGKNQTYVHMT